MEQKKNIKIKKDKRVKNNMQTVTEVRDTMIAATGYLFKEHGYDVSRATCNTNIETFVAASVMLDAEKLLVKEIFWTIPFLLCHIVFKIYNKTPDEPVMKISSNIWFPKKKKAK